MGGNVTKDGPDPVRPTRSRPHWWVVLAVSLSLLALVAATTAEHDNRSTARAGARALSSVRHKGTRSTPDSPPVSTTSTTGLSLQSRPTVTSSTSPSAVETDNLHEEAPESAPASATTTTTTTTTTAPATSSTTTTAPAAATEPPTAQTAMDTGSLQQPNLATASYAFSGAGTMQVSVTWTPAATTLSLTVTCNAVTQGAKGSSPLTVALPDADGPCEATLKETVVEYDAVPYTLTIEPAQGG